MLAAKGLRPAQTKLENGLSPRTENSISDTAALQQYRGAEPATQRNVALLRYARPFLPAAEVRGCAVQGSGVGGAVPAHRDGAPDGDRGARHRPPDPLAQFPGHVARRTMGLNAPRGQGPGAPALADHSHGSPAGLLRVAPSRNPESQRSVPRNARTATIGRMVGSRGRTACMRRSPTCILVCTGFPRRGPKADSRRASRGQDRWKTRPVPVHQRLPGGGGMQACAQRLSSRARCASPRTGPWISKSAAGSHSCTPSAR